MGIKDFLGRKRSSSQEPRGDEPGAAQTPRDEGGEGTVDLGDRLGGGAPGSNQGKTSSAPPEEPGDAGPTSAPGITAQVPELDDMNIGASDPQTSRPLGVPRPAARTAGPPAGEAAPARADSDQAGSSPAQQRPDTDSGSSTGRDTGPEQPAQKTEGTAQREPGERGQTGPDENLETDMTASGEAMSPGQGPGEDTPVPTPGNAQGVSVPGTQSAQGTSEDAPPAQGARTPEGEPKGTTTVATAVPGSPDGEVDTRS